MVFGLVGSGLMAVTQLGIMVFLWVRNQMNDRRSVLGHMPWLSVEILQARTPATSLLCISSQRPPATLSR